jgi:Tol biopolymer transport system component
VLWPRFLPDGRQFIYTELRHEARGQIMLARPDGSSVELVAAESLAQWVEPDWLLFVREGTLLAQRVDLTAGRVRGDPVSLIGLVGHSVVTGWSAFAASLNGTVVAQSHLDESRLAWFDRSGQEGAAVGAPGGYNTVRLSPDASTLAFARMRPELGTYDLWTTDLGRASETRLTSAPGMEVAETWLPDGQSIVFASGQGGSPNIFVKDLATGAERRLLTSPRFQWAEDVSPDGTLVAYRERTDAGDWDQWIVPLASPGQATALFATSASEAHLRFAPSGRAFAFVSDVSSRSQVYLSPFPLDASRPEPVSSTGGSAPRWRRDGRELFFLSAAGQLVAVPIDEAGRPGATRPLFDAKNWTDYDVSPDGQRFIAVVSVANERDQPLTVIVGWPQSAGR